MPKKKELTKAELQIMNILWDRGPSFVNEILADMDEPKPAYTTVSTIVRILVTKDFLSFESFGKSHRYQVNITKECYMDTYLNTIKRDLFQNSLSSLISFFARKESLSQSEVDEIISILNESKKEKKSTP
ncbi:MAG: BlaI/MecI/CopY family transcriptional regulator [Phocaeicola sp.]